MELLVLKLYQHASCTLISEKAYGIGAEVKRTLIVHLFCPTALLIVVWACTYHSKLDKMYKCQKHVILMSAII